MAEEIIFKLEVDDTDAVKSLNKVDESVDNIGKSAEKSKKGVKSFGQTLSNVGKAAGVIGLLVAAFEVLKNTLGENQKVMDVVNTATTAIKIVFNDLFNFITDDLAPALVSLWEAPEQVLISFKKAITDFKDKQLKILFDSIGLLGDAFNKLLEGDITGALKTAGEGVIGLNRALNPLVIVTEALVVGTIAAGEALIDYANDTVIAADAVIQLTKNTALLELQQTRIREQADRDAEQQRQIRDDVNKTIEERIAANNRLGEILDKQQEDETASVEQRIANLQNEQNQLGFKIERYNEIYALQTELIAIEAQQAGFRSEQLINENALLQEQSDLKNEIADNELELKRERIKEEEDFLKEFDTFSDGISKKNKKREDADLAVAKATAKAKIDIASSAISIVASFAEEGSALGKAAAIAQTTIDTYKGATGAYAGMISSVPGPVGIGLGVAAAALVVASGIANIKKITAVKTPGGKSAGGAPGISSTAPAAPPEFNVEQTNDNQLADTIGGEINNNTEPVKAYVVGSDVTSQQQMDRVQLNNATI